jgi:purine-nucleoside phosphorylase
MDPKQPQYVNEALSWLKERISPRPLAAVVLGSGLGALADRLEAPLSIPFGEIPHWPVTRAPGHAAKLVFGRLCGRPVLVQQGRVHYYEGFSMDEVTFSTRVYGTWGIPFYIPTNASGGIHHGLRPGDLVLIQDHINLLGTNPLIGPNIDGWGPRFPDMLHAYDPEMQLFAEDAARENGILLKRGTYVAFTGPSFETPAEIRMARLLGADLVGMSTVPEVIAARHMGMRTCAVSCVANAAAGMTGQILTHEEVLLEMGKAATSLVRLIEGLVCRLEDSGA